MEGLLVHDLVLYHILVPFFLLLYYAFNLYTSKRIQGRRLEGGNILKANLIGVTENLAGLDANLALVGEGFLLFGLFNRLFFPLWYRDVRKVGKPFLIASAAVFLYVVLAVVSTYAVPFVRDRLDTADPAFLGEKAAFLGGSALVYLALTAWAARVSVRRFSALDLQL